MFDFLFTQGFLWGFLATVRLWAIACVISLAIGVVWGALTCSRLRIPVVSRLIEIIILGFQGVPFFVQMLISYFVIPDLLGINPSAFVTGVVNLGLCSGAYMAEIVRSGIGAVPAGQWETCKVLGYSNARAFIYVIAPQALFRMMPAMVNEFNAILKSTSMLSAIGVAEMTLAGKNVIARSFNPGIVYLALAVIYLCMTPVLSSTSRIIEN
ncbi:amino acid ABC transporter permease, partial [Candidatus Babeliales bacterium]|nr:amino acid ABC transporter permease [Candidatus Babeliales bacterium]